MKKLFVTLLALTILSSCTNYHESPATLVRRYVECLQNKQHKKIVKLFYLEEKSSRSIGETKQAMLETFESKMQPEIARLGGISSYKIKDITLSKDELSATVELYIVFGESNGNLQSTNVIKRNGRWYLDPGK